MINRFGADTALLLIDVQRGVDVLDHWGGPTGRRNNPDAEAIDARTCSERGVPAVARWRSLATTHARRPRR